MVVWVVLCLSWWKCENGIFLMFLIVMIVVVFDLLLFLLYYYLLVYKLCQVVFECGQGVCVWDIQGCEFIDLVVGIVVCGLGYNDLDLIVVLIEQVGKFWYISNVFYSELLLCLVEELVIVLCFVECVFLCNFGVEVNEVVIKLVCKWVFLQGCLVYQCVIVIFCGSFYGCILVVVIVIVQLKYQEGYELLLGGFCYVDFNDEVQLEIVMVVGDVVVVMLELIQGEGGVMLVKLGFMQCICDFCDQYGVLMVLDEIQVGMGCIGMLFVYWQDGIKLDIVILVKVLGGGFLIGVMLVGLKVVEVMQFGVYGIIFGGNLLVVVVVCVVLCKLFLLEIGYNVSCQLQVLCDGLGWINDEFKVFSQVCGWGLMLGVVLDCDFVGQVGVILDYVVDKGLLMLQVGLDVLCFVLLLNIIDEEIVEGFKCLWVVIQLYIVLC